MPELPNDPGDILTLADAAAYLKVPEDAVLKMAKEDMIPAQKIGGEWRFLRKALNDWMRFGNRSYRREWPFHPELLFESPFTEDLLFHLEQRLIHRLKAQIVPRPGSKQAILKHFGVFKNDEDLEDRLAEARKRREAVE
jgi:excisionase family DNA binding protein